MGRAAEALYMSGFSLPRKQIFDEEIIELASSSRESTAAMLAFAIRALVNRAYERGYRAAQKDAAEKK